MKENSIKPITVTDLEDILASRDEGPFVRVEADLKARVIEAARLRMAAKFAA